MFTPLNAKQEYLDWLGVEKTGILQKLHEWPMEAVEEKLIAIGHSNKENIKDHILWYKQFMSFKGLRPSVRHGMFSDIIDGVWHMHILYTQDYERFSKEVFGFFIHHIPCNIMDMSQEAMQEYGVWITDYEEAYGHLPKDLAGELTDISSSKGPKCTNHPHTGGGYKCR